MFVFATVFFPFCSSIYGVDMVYIIPLSRVVHFLSDLNALVSISKGKRAVKLYNSEIVQLRNSGVCFFKMEVFILLQVLVCD